MAKNVGITRNLWSHSSINTHVMHSTLYYFPQHPRLRQVSHIDEDIVSWVSVKRRTQSLLVEVVADETD